MKEQCSIGHVLYINILTLLRGFQDKLLRLVVFSLHARLFWELKDKENFAKKCNYCSNNETPKHQTNKQTKKQTNQIKTKSRKTRNKKTQLINNKV